MRNGVARGRVLDAVARTWPGLIMNVVEARAREHVEAGRFDEASVVMEQAVERYGADTVPPLLIAWVCNKAERSEAAREWALRAIEEEPENSDAHWMLATALFALDRGDEAATASRRAVELSPDKGAYYMDLAWIRREARDFAATGELVDKALELEPDDAWVQYTAGRIFEGHRRHRRAQAHYERALELDPGHTEARYHLGALLQTRGRISRGVACVHGTTPPPGDEAEHEAIYAVALRRWSWHWQGWALRSAFVLNIVDWVFPTPLWLSVPLAGLLLAGFVVAWANAFAALPTPCRRDLFAPGRRNDFVAASTLAAVTVAGIASVLLVELASLGHLIVFACIVLGYVHGYLRVARARN